MFTYFLVHLENISLSKLRSLTTAISDDQILSFFEVDVEEVSLLGGVQPLTSYIWELRRFRTSQ